jgi:wyosine [tRNA(Phe)-imidazoG37] synthetase (radical SAM superfamily)
MKHVFGPVPSRRLGRSLGIDVVPFKTCSYDCIYCQLGRTTCKTVERQDWLNWEPLIEQVKQTLDARPDYITFSGSGEPTLHACLGELISRVKSVTTVPVAVLTNGSLLWREDVRRHLQQADLVIPSLDAGDARFFRHINRPHEAIPFEQMVEGLIAFRQEFRGQYWLEVFLLAGYTSVTMEVERIAAWVKRIHPDRVQLNTVARPPVEPSAEPVPHEQLVRLAELFEPRAEVIEDYRQPLREEQVYPDADRILGTLRRRPSTIQEVLMAHGLHRNETIKCLGELTRRGVIERILVGTDLYYRAARQPGTIIADNVPEERV